MPKIDSQQFYTAAIKKHGISPQGLNWRSKESQEIRFAQISKLLPKDLTHCTLGDAGCGFADFYAYLEKQRNLPKKYFGIDIHTEMCHIAQKSTHQKIIQADILKERLPYCDYYICSGALNILTPFETHLFIQNCFKSSKKAFIFNVLYGKKESETYNYLSKEALEKIAKSLGVKEIEFQEGYLQGDITVSFLR